MGVVTWGDDSLGCDSSGVAAQLADGVIAIQGNRSAFAALRRIRIPGSLPFTPTAEAAAERHIADASAGQDSRTMLYGEDLSFAASRDSASCVASSDPCTGQSALTAQQSPLM